MLLLAYPLHLNRQCQDAKIIVRSIVENEQNRKKMTVSLSELINEIRIQAEAEVIIKLKNQSIFELMHN